jgi:hypothetical protein
MSVLKFKNTSNEWQGIMTIMGAQGPEGPVGPQGPAPVKGVDYWTESEKQDLVNEIKSEVGGSDLPLERGTGRDSLKTTNAGRATGEDSLALGPGTYAMENGAFAIGIGAECLYKYAMALGNGVKVSKDNQIVLGAHNIKDENAMIVIGTGSTINRRNGMTINANNQVHFPGTVVVGENKDAIATTAYVGEAITTALSAIGVAEEGAY